MKSRILLLLKYRFIYIAIGLVLTIMIHENIRYILLGIPYVYYMIKMHKKLLLMLSVISVIFIISFHMQINRHIDIASQYEVKVIKVRHKEDKTSFIGEIDEVMVNVLLSDREEIYAGEIYQVEGYLSKPMNNTLPNQFNYKNYLLSKKVFYTLKVDAIEYKGKVYSINTISEVIEGYIDNNIPLSKSYVKTFILADKSDFDQSLLEDVNRLGISHLFAVSGLHVGLLVLAVKFISEKLGVKDKIYQNYTILLLFVYLTITSFSPSILRASLMYVFLVLRDRYKIPISSVDILSIIFILLLIVNPFYHYNPGFVLSFSVTAAIILGNKILRDYEGIIQLFMVGFLAFVSTYFIIFLLNYNINLLTMIFNIIFIIYMTYIILPLSYVTFVFPFVDKILYRFIEMYNSLISTLSKLDMFVFNGNISSPYEIMIIIILVISYFSYFHQNLKRKKLIIALVIVTIFSINSTNFSLEKSVIFLDVRGDSILIQDQFNRCNILIDTGEEDKNHSLYRYLSSVNVRKIDYLFISHFHSDHYGEMDYLKESLKIDNVISPNNSNMYSDELITCGSLSFFIYDLSVDNLNENDNSIMLSVFVEDKHYLFTGDSEEIRENEFVEKYNIQADYLKVAHHGSITSSTENFLDQVSPQSAFITVYRYNRNNHPDDVILDRFISRDIDVYRTDEMGTIEITYLFGFERKKYYRP